MWGSQVYPLQAPLESTHTILDENKSWAPLGAWSGSVLDSIRFYMNKNGGLWFACRNNIPVVYTVKHQFSVSESSSGKGAQLLVLDMKNYWGDNMMLLLCNTHLDPTNIENQKKQLREIYQFIGEVLHSLNNHVSNFSAKQAAFLLCGDFNISSSEAMYSQDIPQIFQNGVVDLYNEYISKNGIKEDYTYEGSNTLSAGAGRASYQARIDYVFRLDKYEFQESVVHFRRLKAVEALVHKQAPGNEFSDHWALTFQLILDD